MIKGYNFKHQAIDADSQVMLNKFMSDEYAGAIGTGCTPSFSGGVLSLTDGFLIIDGHILQVSSESYTPSGTLGNKYLLYEIDLNVAQTATGFSGGAYRLVSSIPLPTGVTEYVPGTCTVDGTKRGIVIGKFNSGGTDISFEKSTNITWLAHKDKSDLTSYLSTAQYNILHDMFVKLSQYGTFDPNNPPAGTTLLTTEGAVFFRIMED